MNIGIYIYDDAEVLDFAGPFEVFSTARRLAQNDWQIFFIAQVDALVKARGGMMISPHYHFANHPPLDMLLVVGGLHQAQLDKPAVINWIRQQAQQVSRIASVCTGAFLLAEAGILDGLSVTTHWEDQAALQARYPALSVLTDTRWVEQGDVMTSGGISAGIDMSLSLVALLAERTLAERTAVQMEYRWQASP
ncbi:MULTISPECIES: DJ-1/PfpI family protein [unclassified Vibrio]|uniref:DJ-1/PfpI family protein n=1 Tax=unclassified Vibrio TaxID=2614977 RepID=UPI001361226E|nr:MULTISPECIES: DJ-1/PfpI family protein [unclassified Vibrio]NAW58548.1 DJ-1/PfpI family protein [Vibrio sp. V36_P2S2PM302]NAX26667.1 DJ-1/PfpI family protein [Vibrio sp. V38_P2S17PM301]NAX31237.1 DJ-1/PfpI family protein [Vibrio sp. V37_P2S8PM304]